jgi:hypothetical protein
VDWRGQPHAGAAPQEAARVPGEEPAPADRAFVHSIFKPRPSPAPRTTRPSNAFADAILTLDDSLPTGTYVDMCSKLPLVDPAQIDVPTHHPARRVGRHREFRRLDRVLRAAAQRHKQFSVMKGISHASFQQKNYMMVYHICTRSSRSPTGVHGVTPCATRLSQWCSVPCSQS